MEWTTVSFHNAPTGTSPTRRRCCGSWSQRGSTSSRRAWMRSTAQIGSVLAGLKLDAAAGSSWTQCRGHRVAIGGNESHGNSKSAIRSARIVSVRVWEVQRSRSDSTATRFTRSSSTGARLSALPWGSPQGSEKARVATNPDAKAPSLTDVTLPLGRRRGGAASRGAQVGRRRRRRTRRRLPPPRRSRIVPAGLRTGSRSVGEPGSRPGWRHG